MTEISICAFDSGVMYTHCLLTSTSGFAFLNPCSGADDPSCDTVHHQYTVQRRIAHLVISASLIVLVFCELPLCTAFHDGIVDGLGWDKQWRDNTVVARVVQRWSRWPRDREARATRVIDPVRFIWSLCLLNWSAAHRSDNELCSERRVYRYTCSFMNRLVIYAVH